MKKTLTVILLLLMILGQTHPAFCESAVFTLSVTIPASVQMPDNTPGTDQSFRSGHTGTADVAYRHAQSVATQQTAHEQIMNREEGSVLVRSIVVL